MATKIKDLKQSLISPIREINKGQKERQGGKKTEVGIGQLTLIEMDTQFLEGNGKIIVPRSNEGCKSKTSKQGTKGGVREQGKEGKNREITSRGVKWKGTDKKGQTNLEDKARAAQQRENVRHEKTPGNSTKKSNQQPISPDIKKARGTESMEVDKEGSQNTPESDSTVDKILMSDVEPSEDPQISYDMSQAQIADAFDGSNPIWEFDNSAKPPTDLWGQGPRGFAVAGELTGYQAIEEVYGVWTGSVAFTVNKIAEGMRKGKSTKKIQITRANWRPLFLTWMDFKNNDKNIPGECFHYLSMGIRLAMTKPSIFNNCITPKEKTYIKQYHQGVAGGLQCLWRHLAV